MSFCDYCSLKGGLCAHLKEIMRHTLRNTDIDGSKLCPLFLGATEPVTTGETEDGRTQKKAKIS